MSKIPMGQECMNSDCKELAKIKVGELYYCQKCNKTLLEVCGKEEIESVIYDIMIIDGPDGHIDGADIITEFIIALLNNEGRKWIEEYRLKNKEKL